MTATLMDAHNLLHNGTIALAEVERNGIRIDLDYLKKTMKKTERNIKKNDDALRQSDIFTEWRKKYKKKTKLGSKAQLADMLFNEMGHEGAQFTEPSPNFPEGKLKCDELTLSQIDDPFIKDYFKNEKLKKVLGTYLKGVFREAVDGFIHPCFWLNSVVTYRSSCTDPNFQNIPIRIPWISKLIRTAFIPREDHILVEIDYGGLEVKISACYNKDPNLISYINDPAKDMHRDMGAALFKCKPSEINKDARFVAKNAFVFAEFYGDWFMSCAENLWNLMSEMNIKIGDKRVKKWLKEKGIDKLGLTKSNWKSGRIETKAGTFVDHVRLVEEKLWKQFKVYAKWKERWHRQYLKTGKIKLLTGFEIEGAFGKNDVINYPIQGSAFHCLLWSLTQLVNKTRSWKTKIVGQIHDSIMADVHKSELRQYLELAKQVMTVDIRKEWKWIIVPLEVDAEGSDQNWYEKKDLAI